jgi:hypothetical protein
MIGGQGDSSTVAGWPFVAFGDEFGRVDRKTVRRYIAAAQTAGVSRECKCRSTFR